MRVQEVYRPLRMTASGKIVAAGGCVGGFFCTTGGTVQITVGEASGGADIVSSFTAVAATYYPLGFFANDGAYVVIGGGAVGTFMVA